MDFFIVEVVLVLLEEYSFRKKGIYLSRNLNRFVWHGCNTGLVYNGHHTHYAKTLKTRLPNYFYLYWRNKAIFVKVEILILYYCWHLLLKQLCVVNNTLHLPSTNKNPFKCVFPLFQNTVNKCLTSMTKQSPLIISNYVKLLRYQFFFCRINVNWNHVIVVNLVFDYRL